MKCIVLLSFVALCYSYPYGSGYGSGYGYGSGLGSGYGLGSSFGSGKYFNINQDGSITVTTGTGKIITISKGIGQNSVITVAGPGLSGLYYGSQPTQGDIVAQILAQYQGDINQNTYQQLLGEIASGVQSGQISNGIYQALQNLYQVGPYQGYWGSQVVGGPFQSQANALVGLSGQQYQQQAYPVYVAGVQQQTQYPYGQVVGSVDEVVVPVGMYQQGQIYPQGLQVTPYPIGYQGVLGQQGVVGTEKAAWKALINNILSGNWPQSAIQYGQYGQQVGPIGQLNQIVQGERAILNKQSQVPLTQLQQQQQQQQLLQQQLQQQQQQQQLQNQQQYVQGLQQKEQQQQEQVLQQQQQQQQQQFNILNYLLNQQTGAWKQQPQGGLYGVYGQGIPQNNIPLVV